MLTSPARGPSGGNLTGRSAGDIVPRGFQKGQLQQFTPDQLSQFQQLFGYLGNDSPLAGLARGDEGAFEQLEAPAWRNFQQAQGQLGSRFAGLGMGGTRGSAFKNEAGQLGSDFAMQLQANRQNLMRQALQDLMGHSEMLLGMRPYQKFLTEKAQKQDSPGFWSQLGSGALSLGGSFLGGPGGSSIGSLLGNLFGNNEMQSGSISNY